MSRPVKVRRICEEPRYKMFVPSGAEDVGTEFLTLDEYEVIRHVDYQNMTHEECAAQMDVSRTTVTEIYESARHKIANALINGKAISIEGGNYRVCDGGECKKDCKKGCGGPKA